MKKLINKRNERFVQAVNEYAYYPHCPLKRRL